jgi:NADPH:quinone reductase-like Zn-dependent oxidoreductase
MRAVLVDNNKKGAEKLYVAEAPTPKPGDGEVLVRVHIVLNVMYHTSI